MIKTIVNIYPNETVYSWLSRLFVRSGYGYKEVFIKDVYKDRSYPDLLFIGGLNEQFLNAVKKRISVEKMLMEHTLFKYYVRFLGLERRKKLYQKVMNNEDGIAISLPDDKDKKNHCLRYCPVCVNEDRSEYGEAYFHTEHQFPKVHICTKHKCKLKDTSLKISEYRKRTFVPLEEIVDDLNIEYIDSSSVEYKVAKYINELFILDIDFENDYKISKFLNLNLKYKYLKFSDTLRNNKLLIKDLMDFYKDLDGYIMNINKLQPILCGYNWNPYEISLIALFEELSVKDLAKFTLGVNSKKVQIDKFDEEYCDKFILLVKGFGEIDKLKIDKKWISEQLGLPVSRIRCSCMPKLCKTISDFKGKKSNWKKLDSEYCVKLNELVKNQPELFEGKNITKEYIGTILQVRDRTLIRLPKLTNKAYQLEKKYNGREYYHK